MGQEADLSRQAERMIGDELYLPWRCFRFRNMGGDMEQDYFADGVSADIIAALSRFREVVVTAGGPSFALKDKERPARDRATSWGPNTS